MSQIELRRRPSRTVPATLVALVVLAVTVLLGVAAVDRLVGGAWPAWVVDPASSVGQQAWGASAVVAAGAIVLLLGIVLLVAAVVPGRRSGVPVPLEVSSAAHGEIVITQRGVARLAAAAADEVDGVEEVDVSASSRAVRVVVVTSSRADADAVRAAVQEAVESRLDVLGSGPVCQVQTRVRVKES